MYSEELMTVSVSTDYTKPDPRERESLQADGTTKGIGEFLLKISVDEEVMIFSGHCEILDGVVNHFTSSHFFRFGIYYTHQSRTDIRGGSVVNCPNGWMDGWMAMAWLRGFYITIHTCINSLFFYFTLLIFFLFT